MPTQQSIWISSKWNCIHERRKYCKSNIVKIFESAAAAAIEMVQKSTQAVINFTLTFSPSGSRELLRQLPKMSKVDIVKILSGILSEILSKIFSNIMSKILSRLSPQRRSRTILNLFKFSNRVQSCSFWLVPCCSAQLNQGSTVVSSCSDQGALNIDFGFNLSAFVWWQKIFDIYVSIILNNFQVPGQSQRDGTQSNKSPSSLFLLLAFVSSSPSENTRILVFHHHSNSMIIVIIFKTSLHYGKVWERCD